MGDKMTPTLASVKAKPTGKHDHEQDKEKEEEEEEEQVVTLSDVLKHNELMTETADAVLGDASATHCSYPMGYIRQAVYACLTCTPDAFEKKQTRAGLCLACTYNCHQDHELIELYTKRTFRCDCGTQSFPENNPCKLEMNKAPKNVRNTYSQNYGGRYCTCHRPYPDPERTTPEIMVQCIVCEDWLHEEHIFNNVVNTPTRMNAAGDASGLVETDNESSADGGDTAIEPEDVLLPQHFDELICLDCMKKHPFLMAYTVNGHDVEDQVGDEVTVGIVGDVCEATHTVECVLQKKQQQYETKGSLTLQPTFWPSEWRKNLCQCSSCIALFEKHGIAFLLDPGDSLHVYEASARENKVATDEEMAQRAFANKLTHEQQVEVAMGYSLMKNNLQQYLAEFAAKGKTVRKEDIDDFFRGLSQLKRPKIE